MAEKGSATVGRDSLLTGIDVGASKVCAVVASPTGEPLGLAVAPMPGWPERSPTPAEVGRTIAAAVMEADLMTDDERSRHVWVALSGAAARIAVYEGVVKNGSQERSVTQADFEKAASMLSAPGASPMHRLLVASILDGVETLEEPVGRAVSRFEAKLLVVEADGKRREDIRQALTVAGLEAQGFIAAESGARYGTDAGRIGNRNRCAGSGRRAHIGGGFCPWRATPYGNCSLRRDARHERLSRRAGAARRQGGSGQA